MIEATLPGTQTKADMTFAAAGTLAEQITPAPFVRLVSSAAITLTAEVYQPSTD